MFELSDAERIQVVKHVVKVTNGAVPIVAAGTFGGTADEQADFIKRMNDTGTEAVVIITGMMATEEESDKILDDRIFQLMELTEDVQLGLYECPVPYKRIISANQLKQFVATNRMIYLKDTCLDIEQVKAKLESVKGHKFGLYDAYAAHAVDSLKAGSAGLSCIQGNFFPELIVWLCNNYDNDMLKNEVEKVQQLLIDNMDVVHHVYPIIAKYFLQKRGVNISTFTRRKVGEFTPDTRMKVDKLYTDLGHLQKELELDITGYPF
jgi:4-hydroxy-tetrahydrodipicolinate synthase